MIGAMASNSDDLSSEEIILIEDELNNCDATEGGKMQCIFTWCIKNFSSCQLECGDELCSPIFSADSAIRWYMSVFPSGQTEYEDYVSVHVIPLSTPECDRKMYCKISILDTASEKWHSEKSEQDCGQLRRFEFKAFVTQSKLLAEKCRALPDDTLTICCQMCTIDVEQTNVTRPPAFSESASCNTQLRRFSNHFGTLYKSGKFSDVSLTLKDDTIRAHRVILSARSPEFARLLESQAVNDVSIPEFDKITMDALLSYIYTGEIPSCGVLPLELYEAAKKFGVSELERSITPSRIFAQTEVIKEQYSYTWRLKNFTRINRSPGRMIYSDKFYTGPTELWSLSLYFKNRSTDDEDENIGIYLHKLWRVNDKKAVFVQFKLYVLDKDKQQRFKIDMEKCYKHTNRFGSSSFLKKSILDSERSSLLPGDTLTICCDMNVSDSASLSKIQHSYSSSVTDLFEISDIRNLSDCFGRLLHSNANADVSVKCSSKKKFSLHKAILSARSPKFVDFFERQDIDLKQFTIDISGIRPEVLELLFLLIYTGEVEGLSCETALDLYTAATYYEISEAKDIFSNYLTTNLTTDNAFKMMALGMTMDDDDLKTSVLDFVCSHAEELINNSQWSDFARDHPNWSSEILKCLAEGYRESKRRRLN